MKKFKKKISIGIGVLSVLIGSAFGQTTAFPGAKGKGRFASGGRSGDVYHVTNLSDSGKGSFRDAVSQSNRLIVFNVSGVIKIDSKVQVASNITIAGQTAPGDGIVIYGDGVTFSGSKNVIARYLRLRGSIEMGRGTCALVADNAENMIFDHISIQWGRWDNLHIKKSNNITLQHCIIGEAIDPQRFGALFEVPTNISVYNCLWIDNQSRNPKAKAKMEFVNNVVYNWGVTGFVGGHSSAHHYQDIINNYFIAGPNSNESFAGQFTATDHVFQKGNKVDLNKNGILDGGEIDDHVFVKMKLSAESQPSTYEPTVRVFTAEEAYYDVVKNAGCSHHRDQIDLRLINYLTSLGKEGAIYHNEQEAGGQPEMKTGKAAKDTDGDGIPDKWERKHHSDKKDAKDAGILLPSGYSRLEEYMNSII